tara:strand:+ start:28155 stop:28364 length:210 start_codon:yes stop_codon:yes gene_type:complete
MMQMKKIGQLVRDTRKKQGLTQEELSAATAIGVRFIRELEQGKESCHIGKTLTVLAMLGIEIKVNGDVL